MKTDITKIIEDISDGMIVKTECIKTGKMWINMHREEFYSFLALR